MKKFLLIITSILLFTSFNNIFAETNDSLAIEQLKQDVSKLRIKALLTENKYKKQKEDARFKPISFTIGPVFKIFSCIYDAHTFMGLATKFSFKQWNYKHYIYADFTIGEGEDYLSSPPPVSFAVGYLYNINNYIMIGGVFDALTITPGAILSITNDKYFGDFHLGLGGYGIGMGFSFGMCF